MENIAWIPVYGDTKAAVSSTHRFGTDAMLLSWFASPRPGEAVCELGTGCGAIALRLCAGWRPARVHGVDIQPEAVRLAQMGAEAFTGSPCPTFAVGDWSDPKSIAPANSFKRVVCNPPYFPPDSGQVNREEAVRLARHEQPDTLMSLCRAAAWLLSSGGSFCLCHRPQRLPAVFRALTANGLEPKQLLPVQKRADTPPWLFLLEARLDGRPGLSWQPPLVLYTDTAQPSQAMREIYREIIPG